MTMKNLFDSLIRKRKEFIEYFGNHEMFPFSLWTKHELESMSKTNL